MTPLSYDNIQSEAESFALQYRQTHQLPYLPSVKELQPFNLNLQQTYPTLFKSVKNHVLQFDPEGGHGFDHLTWVSSLATWIAERETQIRRTSEDIKQKAIDYAGLAGLLHDIERHRGFGEDHMIEGAKTARRLLAEDNITAPEVITVVRYHDHLDFDPGENELLQIVFGSVFDADHFRYGLEREDTFWRMKEKKGKPPEDTIHDYQFLPAYRNAWRTNYGQKVGPKLIDFGVAIAKHIEEKFGND